MIARDAVTLRLWEITYGDLPVVMLSDACRWRPSFVQRQPSALGDKRKQKRVTDSFALAHTTDITQRGRHVRFGPVADIEGRQPSAEKEEAPTGGRGFFGFLWGEQRWRGKSITYPIIAPLDAIALAFLPQA